MVMALEQNKTRTIAQKWIKFDNGNSYTFKGHLSACPFSYTLFYWGPTNVSKICRFYQMKGTSTPKSLKFSEAMLLVILQD